MKAVISFVVHRKASPSLFPFGYAGQMLLFNNIKN